MENMYMFRIYTENKNKPETVQTVGLFFDGFTVFDGVGYWKGAKENSLMFEIISPNTKRARENINTIGETIKRHNQQQAVFVTRQPLGASLI